MTRRPTKRQRAVAGWHDTASRLAEQVRAADDAPRDVVQLAEALERALRAWRQREDGYGEVGE